MVRIAVHVTPGARDDAIVGWEGDVLRVKVRARPEKGHANQALIDLLARRLGVAPGSLTIVRGASSRHKLVKVDGLTEDFVRRVLGDTQRAS